MQEILHQSKSRISHFPWVIFTSEVVSGFLSSTMSFWKQTWLWNSTFFTQKRSIVVHNIQVLLLKLLLGSSRVHCIWFGYNSRWNTPSYLKYLDTFCKIFGWTDNVCHCMDVSKNRGTPKSSILIGFFHYKPSILGYPYFFSKHPYFR